MFGEAKFALSKYGKPVLVHESAGLVRQYRKKKEKTSKISGQTTATYLCIGCETNKSENDEFVDHKVPILHVKNGQLLEDPEQFDHICPGVRSGQHLANQVIFIDFLLSIFSSVSLRHVTLFIMILIDRWIEKHVKIFEKG
jgi:hypothetical protein